MPEYKAKNAMNKKGGFVASGTKTQQSSVGTDRKMQWAGAWVIQAQPLRLAQAASAFTARSNNFGGEDEEGGGGV